MKPRPIAHLFTLLQVVLDVLEVRLQLPVQVG